MKNFASHNQDHFLTLANPLYRQIVFEYISSLLLQDFGQEGDISTQSVIPKNAEGRAFIKCNSDGILAGREELEGFLSDKLNIEFFKKDGEIVYSGDVVFEVFGRLHDILKYERLILNFLGRMSGVATFTRSIVDMAPDVLICPTRKTFWGMLDKKAVSVGGGGTHRLGLYDAILLKDNHLAYFKGDIDAMLARLEEYDGECGKFVEVEVDSIFDAEEVIKRAESRKQKTDTVNCILLDNMSFSDTRKVVEFRNARKSQILLEASGGINKENVEQYAKTGVDIISMGALTMDAHYLDFGLDVE